MNKKNTLLLVSLSFGLSATSSLIAQPTQTPPTLTPTKTAQAPNLTSEQRREFAKARETISRDPEFQAAQKRVEEAQAALERLLYHKLNQAAPDLSDYIRYLQQSRNRTDPTSTP